MKGIMLVEAQVAFLEPDSANRSHERPPAAKEFGELLDAVVENEDGGLIVEARYYRGDIGFGTPHHGYTGVETVIRSIIPTDVIEAETAFILAIPEGLGEVSITVRDNNGKFSSVYGSDVGFVHVPKGLQVHGKIGNHEFLTAGDDRIQFGGWLGLKQGGIGRVVMNGDVKSVVTSEQNPTAELGNTGIVAGRLPR